MWGFAEGSNTITPNAEASPSALPACWSAAARETACSSSAAVQAYCYGGLDIVTKVFFGWIIIGLGPILSRQNQEVRPRVHSCCGIMRPAPCTAPAAGHALAAMPSARRG